MLGLLDQDEGGLAAPRTAILCARPASSRPVPRPVTPDRPVGKHRGNGRRGGSVADAHIAGYPRSSLIAISAAS